MVAVRTLLDEREVGAADRKGSRISRSDESSEAITALVQLRMSYLEGCGVRGKVKSG